LYQVDVHAPNPDAYTFYLGTKSGIVVLLLQHLAMQFRQSAKSFLCGYAPRGYIPRLRR
jgi:hypothetical protein